MTTKNILIGLAVVATLTAIIIFWKPIWNFITGKKDDLNFGFNLGGNASNVLSILQSRSHERGIGAYVDIPLTTLISNTKGKSVDLKNLAGSISYGDEAILQTKANSTKLADVKVPEKGQAPATVTDSVQVLINPSSIKYFTEFISGKNPEVKYNFTALVLGKPQSFTNTTTIKPIG